MYRLKITDWFSAGHQLKGYQGECEELHGHNFKVELIVAGRKLNSIGLLVDFKELKKLLSQVLEELDHKVLNHLPSFRKSNPSSENIARYISEKISSRLPKGVKLIEVWVWESESAGASYQSEE